MKVSGFTFLRNGQKLGYPFVASIRSILPIVDEFIHERENGADGLGEWIAENLPVPQKSEPADFHARMLTGGRGIEQFTNGVTDTVIPPGFGRQHHGLKLSSASAMIPGRDFPIFKDRSCRSLINVLNKRSTFSA